MNVLLTGAAGQLGTELYPLLSDMGQVTAVDLLAANHKTVHAMTGNYRQLDLSDSAALEIMLNRLQPDLIINASGFTAVDKAEEEPVLAFRINAKVPGRIARWAKQNDCALLHYSTDYVFDGTSTRPYRESDQPSPLSIYGESKLAGEMAIKASGCRHLIIRTSWVYSGHGSNFVLSMLKLAEQRLHLSVVDDQVGCPTWARNLAQASGYLIRKGLPRCKVGEGNIFHYCDADTTSWHDFAQRVFSTAVDLGLLDQSPNLKRVSSGEYPQLAVRPGYSVLDTFGIRKAGFDPVGLDESLHDCMKELADNAHE